MRVLVDTSVWSLALRRRDFDPESPGVKMLTQLVQEFQVVMMGAIRQELLSGVRDERQFDRLCEKLRAFPDVPTQMEDFETAARFYNICRAKGIQGSNTDFLLCAVAHRHDFELLSADKDFEQYNKHLEFKLRLVTA